MENNNNVRNLKFRGQGSVLTGIFLVNLLLTVLTLGIYYAWAKVKTKKYIYSSTYLEESSFQYHATGKELFMGYLKVFVLVILFYGSIFLITWLFPQQIWILSIVTVVFYLGILFLIPIAIHSSLKYETAKTSWRSIHWGYEGDLKVFMKDFYIGIFYTIISLGFYSLWLFINIRKYITSNVKFGNISFKYDGTAGAIFFIYLKGYFLSIITLGIYLPFLVLEVYNYHINNTYAIQDERILKFKSNIKGWSFFFFELVNLLMIFFSLGIAIGWVVCRQLEYYTKNVDIVGDFRSEDLIQTQSDFNNASGDALMDGLDISLI
ncbi:MAG: DUF898 family protein [Cytophagales bacterium]